MPKYNPTLLGPQNVVDFKKASVVESSTDHNVSTRSEEKSPTAQNNCVYNFSLKAFV